MRRFLLITFLVVTYQAQAQDSLDVRSLIHWNTDHEPDESFFDLQYNEVWGYSQEGREYAIIGSNVGTHFVDITSPAEVEEVDFIPGVQTGPFIVHRDYHNLDNYLYVVAQEGPARMKIVDLSFLPDSVEIVHDSDDLVGPTHNIFIDTVQTRLYAVATSLNGWGVTKVLDLSDPVNPAVVDTLHEGSDDVYVHDLYVNNGVAFLNQIYGSRMQIWDFTELPGEYLGSISDYEGQGLNHSGYLAEDGNTYAMVDENHGSPIKILDVSDPSDIEIVATVSSGVHESSVPHNVIIKDNILYCSYYFDGLYIWDIQNPETPTLKGYYDTSELPNYIGYGGAWGVYPFLPSGRILVSDMESGLWVLEYDETLGIQKKSPPSVLNIWPNPCNNLIYVGSEVTIGESYLIRDLTGRVVENGIIDANRSIDVGLLRAGAYLFHTTQGDRKITSRFVKR